MTRFAAAGLVVLIAVGPAFGQDRPAIRASDNSPRQAVPAPRPSPRPAAAEPQPPQPAVGETQPPLANAGQSQGALIPPEAAPGPAAEPVASNAAPDPGPSVPESLRENDFDHAACRLALFQLGAALSEVAAVTESGRSDCGIARPVTVTAIRPGVVLEGGATLRCQTALQLARWTRDVVEPASSHLPGAPRLTAMGVGTGYQCRAVIGNGTPDKTSEHALGNAIDIASFTFDDGVRLPVAPVADRGDLSVAFQNAVQGAACLFFTTVLGPGSNAAHDDHLHLDIKSRRGGFRLCQ